MRAFVLAVLLCPAVASAAEPTPLARGAFEGRSGGMLSGWVDKLFDSRATIGAPTVWASAAERLGVDPDTQQGGRQVAAELEVVGVLSGTLGRRGKSWRAKVVLRTFEPEATITFTYRSRSRRRVYRALRRGLYRKFRATLEAAQVPAPPAPPVVEAPPPPPPPPPVAPPPPPAAVAEAERAPAQRDHAAVEAQLGFQWGGRRYGYRDPLIGDLRGHQTNGIPAVAGRLTLFPGAFFDGGALTQHLGVDARFAVAVGLDTEVAGGAQQVDTSAYRFAVAAQGRLVLGEHQLHLLLGYARDTFTLGDGDLVPSVAYGGLRAGLEGRFALVTDLSLRAEAGYRVLTQLGGLDDPEWFPNASGGGFDAGLGLAYRIAWQVELRLAVGYRQYFFSFDPEVGDPRVAGGAADRFLDATLGLGVALD